MTVILEKTMPSKPNARWIVLINKSPRGPLTEAEVRALLAQGMIRHNDVAYQVTVEAPTQHSEWKLLWQFEEFNRRSPESHPKKKAVPTDEEKRAKIPEKQLVKQALDELPEDLLDIAPEDLLPRSRSLHAVLDENHLNDRIEKENKASARMPSVSIPGWAYGAVALVLISFGALHWLLPRFEKMKLSHATSPMGIAPMERPGNSNQRSPASGLPLNDRHNTPVFRPTRTQGHPAPRREGMSHLPRNPLISGMPSYRRKKTKRINREPKKKRPRKSRPRPR